MIQWPANIAPLRPHSASGRELNSLTHGKAEQADILTAERDQGWEAGGVAFPIQ